MPGNCNKEVAMPFLDGYKIRYILAGGSNTIVTYLVYILLLRICNYYVAYSFSFVLSIVISYCLNTLFVFKTQFSWIKFLMFPSVYFTQYLCGLIMLHGIITYLHLSPLIAPIVVTATTWPISFMVCRFVLTSNKLIHGVH